MKKLFFKVGRFFWSWGFLKFILWSITIIVLIFVEENWRGARDWAATKAKWEAQGESFDYNRLIPPPVPDAQNLAAIPLFRLEPDPEDKGALAPLALRKAYRAQMPGNNLSFHTGNWQVGQVTDMAIVRKGIAVDYNEAFVKAPLPVDPLAQFDALYPFLTDLRAEAVLRPYCRFDHEYPPRPPYYDFFTLVTPQIHVARILNAHALLALDDHRPDLALADLQTHFKLASAVTREPMRVSGLVAVGMMAIGFSAVYEGLALHAWDDAQLAELQEALSRIDFLSAYQLDLRGEVGITVSAFDNLKVNRKELVDQFKLQSSLKGQDPKMKGDLFDLLPLDWPSGWIDQNKRQVVDAQMEAIHWIDLKARRAYPQDSDQLDAEKAKRRVGPLFAPWNFFAVTAYSSLTTYLQKFSLMQTWIDEARIACGLERYRLAHGAYPETLDALVPACIPELPHDIINGQPYRYGLRSDGTFFLYSVGWNQQDDGGKIVFKKESPTAIDNSQGDWVWPTPQWGTAE